MLHEVFDSSGAMNWIDEYKIDYGPELIEYNRYCLYEKGTQKMFDKKVFEAQLPLGN